MSTKDNIVSKAVSLFNEKGISSVTMRQIAESLSMSPGNLTYHFKTKESLLEMIYDGLHAESGDYISFEKDLTLYDFEKILFRFYDLRKSYTFFFNDLVYIIRQFPGVARMYQEANISRFRQSRRLVDHFVKTGRMKEESALLDYNKVIHSIWMINTFWPSQHQVMNTPEYPYNRTTPIEMTWQLIVPFLTEKGLHEYNEIRNIHISQT